MSVATLATEATMLLLLPCGSTARLCGNMATVATPPLKVLPVLHHGLTSGRRWLRGPEVGRLFRSYVS
jgi:hypothetical protein